jgi:hypothetical protein
VPAVLHACLSACLPGCLPNCLKACMDACMQAAEWYLLACLWWPGTEHGSIYLTSQSKDCHQKRHWPMALIIVN